ncbi:MAG: ubiquitin-like small modifier protein 1 [Halobacteriaceae archaeon]
MEWRLFADLAEVAGDRRVPAEGATVEEALDALLAARPELRERVVEDGDLRETITVLRNGGTVRDLSAPVEDGDELALMPPVSGG